MGSPDTGRVQVIINETRVKVRTLISESKGTLERHAVKLNKLEGAVNRCGATSPRVADLFNQLRCEKEKLNKQLTSMKNLLRWDEK